VEGCDGAPRGQADALRQLGKLHQVLGQKDQHRPIIRISLPPAPIGTWPSDRAYSTAAAQDVCLVRLQHHRHAHPVAVPAGEECLSPATASWKLVWSTARLPPGGANDNSTVSFRAPPWARVLRLGAGMPEVGPGVGLERFELVARGDAYCVIDIVDQQMASILLTALPEFPLEVEADKARRFVEAWRQRASMVGEPYEVRLEQREV
jgi:hypothetical protein